MIKKVGVLSLMLLLFLCSCGIKSIPKQYTEVESSWTDLEKQFVKRSNIVPRMALVVRSHAASEKEILGAAMMSRAYAVQNKIGARDLNEENVKKIQTAEEQLAKAASKLVATADKYPSLKTDTKFKDLNTQLESAEKDIQIAKVKYAQEAEKFNDLIGSFPTNLTNRLFFHHQKKGTFALR